MHPNPAQNEIYVLMEAAFEGRFEVYNLRGQLQASSTDHTINISHLSQGIYVLLMRNGNGKIESMKFVKH
ncbi:MAG: T9SS type A sorting domain-containing protein [Bacteroidota bacterium]